MEEKRYKGTGPTYEELAQAVRETTGGNITAQDAEEVLNRDMAPIANEWRGMASSERLPLETLYASTGDKEKAIGDVLKKWDTEFGKPRKVLEIGTNRDIYNALKSVYDSTGDWEQVYKVAKYNNVPKELMDEFVKDGRWTDYSVGDELGSGVGAFLRGATDSLYGGIANVLNSDYAAQFADKVPNGMEFDDEAKTRWRAGVRQAEEYGRSLMETDPGMEIVGQGVGMWFPVGWAGKATKGLKVSQGLTRGGRIANTFARGAATGALTSIPGSLAKESAGDAVENTLAEALMFGGGDVAFSGLGAALGATKRTAGRALNNLRTPSENYTKAFEKIKRVEDMSAEELKRGAERGWLKDGKLNVSKYLADEYGLAAGETMEDLWRVAKNNREVYNQLRSELADFNYREAVANAARKSRIPHANLSRVNQVLDSIPERLEKFSEGAKWYDSLTGEQLAQTMKAFNEDVKKALTSIKNPNALEKQAIENYLRELESQNMLQFMKKQMPTQFQAIDKNTSLLGEFGKLFNINNAISQFTASSRFLNSRTDRNFMRQVMSGHKKQEKGSLKKLMDIVDSQKTEDRLRTMIRMAIKANNKE